MKMDKEIIRNKNSRREKEEIPTDSVETTVEKLIVIAIIGMGA